VSTFRRRLFLLLSLALFSLLTACAPQETRRSAWGPIRLIASADAIVAPAAALTDGTLRAAWVGADARGVHHDFAQPDGTSVTLPLPPRNPYGQVLLPSSSGYTHLLWLDVDARGQTALYTALISPDSSVERGPTEVSSAAVTSFSAVHTQDGRAAVVWAQGEGPVSAIFLSTLDASGRPGPAAQIAPRGNSPALVRAADGSVLAFWRAGGRLVRARLAGGALLETSDLTADVALAAGDALVSLSAGLTDDTGALFWNIVRARSGASETWASWGPSGGSNWPAPVRLSLGEAAAPIALVAAPATQTESLIAAARIGAQLGIIRLENSRFRLDGIIVSEVTLAVPPTLLADATGRLTLAWYDHAPGAVPHLLSTSQ
jgi:hypothetical protein